MLYIFLLIFHTIHKEFSNGNLIFYRFDLKHFEQLGQFGF